MEKSNKGLKVAIVMLILIVLGLGGYIAYDKLYAKEEDEKVENKEKEVKEENLENIITSINDYPTDNDETGVYLTQENLLTKKEIQTNYKNLEKNVLGHKLELNCYFYGQEKTDYYDYDDSVLSTLSANECHAESIKIGNKIINEEFYLSDCGLEKYLLTQDYLIEMQFSKCVLPGAGHIKIYKVEKNDLVKTINNMILYPYEDFDAYEPIVKENKLYFVYNPNYDYDEDADGFDYSEKHINDRTFAYIDLDDEDLKINEIEKFEADYSAVLGE